MQWLVARLRPEAAFGSLPKGDMLFGQLCWAIRHRFGEARLETLLEGYTDGQPFLVISDAFPAGFLPRPELPLPGDTPPDQRKARKRGRYLASRLFAAPLPAQPAKDEIAESPFEAHPQPHNSISRLTGTTGNGSDPYQMQRWWWRHHGLDAGGNGPALEIHCLLDTARLSPHDLGTLLEDMGALGFGRDASIGLGRFALERLDATEPPGAASGERLLALAADTKARAVTAQRLATLTQRQDKDALHQALRLTADPLERQKLFNRLETLYQQRPAYARAWTYSAPELGRQVILTAEAAPATRKPVEEFCFLRLYDDALPFVDISEAFAQAAYAGRGDQAWKAMAYGEPTLGTLPEDFRLEVMPRMVAELLYPAPYRDVLVEQARRRNVDPRLLLAIARQESRFNPGVKSPVGARGMFQFIDTTADRTAQKLNLTDVTRTDLYEPRFAIQLAAQYVAELFALFPAHPAAVAAAYNGGETATARWRARAGNDQARFAAEVGYAETKDYVFKVMTNYRAYRQLFDEDLRPRRA
ncbi:MAG: transglycosylase SLT domain-containing protein [Chloracidobacterium sp.]